LGGGSLVSWGGGEQTKVTHFSQFHRGLESGEEENYLTKWGEASTDNIKTEWGEMVKMTTRKNPLTCLVGKNGTKDYRDQKKVGRNDGTNTEKQGRELGMVGGGCIRGYTTKWGKENAGKGRVGGYLQTQRGHGVLDFQDSGVPTENTHFCLWSG